VDLDEVLDFGAPAAFDGALANFGVLNCVADHRRLARALAGSVRRGGRIVLVVMGPFCPWEWFWYAGRGHMRKALRRVRTRPQARFGGSPAIRLVYPSPARVEKSFAPYFRRRRLAGIGIFLPPPFAAVLTDSRPALARRLATVDDRIRYRFPATILGDHFLMVLERV
jgi:hypothetical protein